MGAPPCINGWNPKGFTAIFSALVDEHCRLVCVQIDWPKTLHQSASFCGWFVATPCHHKVSHLSKQVPVYPSELKWRTGYLHGRSFTNSGKAHETCVSTKDCGFTGYRPKLVFSVEVILYLEIIPLKIDPHGQSVAPVSPGAGTTFRQNGWSHFIAVFKNPGWLMISSALYYPIYWGL